MVLTEVDKMVGMLAGLKVVELGDLKAVDWVAERADSMVYFWAKQLDETQVDEMAERTALMTVAHLDGETAEQRVAWKVELRVEMWER